MSEPNDADSLISNLRLSIERLTDERTHAEGQMNTLLGKLKAAEDKISQLQSLLLNQAVAQSPVNWVKIEDCWFSVQAIRSLYVEGSAVKIDGVIVSLHTNRYPEIANRIAQLKRRVRVRTQASPSAGTKAKASPSPKASSPPKP